MERFQKICAASLVSLLLLVVGQLSANAQSSAGDFSVTVSTPGTFGSVMLQKVQSWTDVVTLTVSGHLNASDMAYFSRLKNLKKLDLGATDITTVTGCKDLASLELVVLPETVKVIGNDAFNGCTSLSSISLNNIEHIGASAFYYCIGLRGTIVGPKVKEIGDNAFRACSNIEAISFPVIENIGMSAFNAATMYYDMVESKLESAEISNVKSIGREAFRDCEALRSIDLRNCESMEDGCFEDCSELSNVVLSDKIEEIPSKCFSNSGLQTIELPSSLKTIGASAFRDSKLSNITIPEGVIKIEDYAFSGCPAVSIDLPSTIAEIGYNAFDSALNTNISRGFGGGFGDENATYYLQDVYCKRIIPLETSAFRHSMVKSATLHVPSVSISAYRLDDNWGDFNKIEAISGDITNLPINDNFTLIDYTGISDNTNITLLSTQSGFNRSIGHLTVSGESALSLNNFVHSQSLERYRYGYNNPDTYPYCSTLITNSEVRANSVTTIIKVPTNAWSFVSFPYDVKVSSIVAPDGAMWVVRRYNGSNRAAMSGDTWENVTSDQILNSGEGYIFHCTDPEGDAQTLEFEFPAIDNSNKNNLFTTADVVKNLNEYPAEFSHNQGWNLIGNPYPCYFSSRFVDFPAPITVWDGGSYIAYSLVDDDFSFHPHEAFFVQCTDFANQIKFLKDGRSHDYVTSSDPYSVPANAQSAGARSILNLMLAGESYSDRARLVLNEAATSGYEIDKDASKFMSSDESVPQIYIIDNGINYAIDERPLGSGEFSLGMRIGKKGSYRISLDANCADYDILLIDNETNVITDLTDASYSFESSAQTANNRFAIKVSAKESSIESVPSAEVRFSVSGHMLSVDSPVAVSIYSVDGKLLYSGIVDGSIELRSGIYLLSVNNTTHKIAIK